MEMSRLELPALTAAQAVKPYFPDENCRQRFYKALPASNHPDSSYFSSLSFFIFYNTIRNNK